MIRDLLVIDIFCLCQILISFLFQNIFHIRPDARIRCKTADIFCDFLGNRCGKHTGIRTRIGCQLLFIQLLHDLQCLIRADLKQLGAFVLQLRQIKQKWWIFRFFLFLCFYHLKLQRLWLH